MNLINRSVFSALLVGMTVFTFSGCAEDFSLGTDTTTVTGRVVQGDDPLPYSWDPGIGDSEYSPADAATVTYISTENSATVYEATTNADGYWEIPGVPSGGYNIKVSKDGYEDSIYPLDDNNNATTVDNGRRETDGVKHVGNLMLFETNMTAEIALFGITLEEGVQLDHGINNDFDRPTYSIAKGDDITVTYSYKDPDFDATNNNIGWIRINGNWLSGTSTDGLTYKFLAADFTGSLGAGFDFDIRFGHNGETPIHKALRGMGGASITIEALP